MIVSNERVTLFEEGDWVLDYVNRPEEVPFTRAGMARCGEGL